MNIDRVPIEKQLQKLKLILEKQHSREVTDHEVRQAWGCLQKLTHVINKSVSIDARRKELLKENPKGFHLEDGGTCQVCGDHAVRENSWYDNHGIKCMPCQAAINEKIISTSIIQKKDSWYSIHELERYFNIKGADLNKYIKKMIIKSRIIKGTAKKVHFQLFLIKDNKGVLPPKSLLKSRMVTVIHKGKEYFTLEEWYETGDLKVMKRIAKYRIIECLKETLQKPMTGGRLLIPRDGVNPLFSRSDKG